MTKLATLIARWSRADEKARKASAERAAAKRAIHEWGREQIKDALAKMGITPGKSVVRMKVRLTRKGRTVLEQTECLLERVGRVDPPTMERGALGPNASSTDMWWTAHIWWRNIRKDGTPGATHDYCLQHGDTAADLVGKIEHVRDLEITPNA